MTTMTLDDRFAAVRRRIKDGTLTRRQWEFVDADGRALATAAVQIIEARGQDRAEEVV